MASILFVAKAGKQADQIRQGLSRYINRQTLDWHVVDCKANRFTTLVKNGTLAAHTFSAVVCLSNLKETCTWASEQDIPVALFGNHNKHYPAAVNISVDNHRLAQLAVQHFMEQGIQHALSLDAYHPWPSIRNRHEAFVQACAEYGLPCLKAPDVGRLKMDSVADREAFLVSFIKDLPTPCGAFCHQDLKSLWLANLCLRHDISVPEHISILGVDDDERTCEGTHPTLSSIALPWQHIGYDLLMGIHRILGGEHTQIIGQCQAVLVKQRESTNAPQCPDKLIRKAIRRIKNRKRPIPTISELAESCKLSRKHFTARFQAAMGMPPKQFQLAERMQRAQILLSAADSKLPQVAKQVGYKSYPQFSLTFKRLVGCSPQEFHQRCHP